MTYIVPNDEYLGMIGPFPSKYAAAEFGNAHVRTWGGFELRDGLVSPADWLAVEESEREDEA